MADSRYQERFQNYQEAPSAHVWEGIQDKLDQRQKYLQRQAYGLSSILLILLSGFFLGILYEDWDSGSAQSFKNLPEHFVLADSLIQPNNSNSKAWFDRTRKMTSNRNSGATKKQRTKSQGSPKSALSQSNQYSSDNSARVSRESSKALASNNKEALELHKQRLLSFEGNLSDRNQAQSPIENKAEKSFDKHLEKATSSWSVGIRAGIARQKPNYKVKQPYNPAIKEQLKQANGPAKVLSATLIAHYQLNNHWHLTSGIGLEQVQRSFTYRPHSAFKRNPAPANEEDDEADLTANNISRPEKQSTTNSSAYLQLPLRLQYKFSLHRFDFGLEGGITIRRIVKVTGKQINPLTQRISDRSSRGSDLQTWQSNVVLRPSVGYQLAPHWQVTLAPQASVAMKSRYQEPYPISNKPYRFGVQAGINYNF